MIIDDKSQIRSIFWALLKKNEKIPSFDVYFDFILMTIGRWRTGWKNMWKLHFCPFRMGEKATIPLQYNP